MTVKVIRPGGSASSVTTAVRVVTGGRGPVGRPGSTVADVPLFVAGTMVSNELLGGVWISTPITTAAARCKAVASAPTADAAIRYTLDGVDLFSITWAAGETDGDLSAVPATIPTGLLRAYAPAVVDVTFGDLFILISGDRS